LRLRIETLDAQRKEALQRVVDLQRMADGALRMPFEGDDEEIGRAAALESATQELLLINQKQNELEIAFAKASARESLESQLQTACGGCLQYKQKVTVQRTELDRQFEALRAEMASSASELERGKHEVRAAAVAYASRQESEAARALTLQARTAELEELHCRARNTKDALRVLELHASELADRNRGVISAQQDLNLKYQNVGEGCVKAYSDTTAMQQILSAAEPSVNFAHSATARASAEINRMRKVLEEVRLAVAETSDSAQGLAPFAEERLRNGEMQIAELTEAFASLEGKHTQLGDQMRCNVERVDNIEKEVEAVTNKWTMVSNGGG
jgi:chromosome segregation ATPase